MRVNFEEITKICSKCGFSKPFNKFEKGRIICSECRYVAQTIKSYGKKLKIINLLFRGRCQD